jgi:hypothetical protein
MPSPVLQRRTTPGPSRSRGRDWSGRVESRCGVRKVVVGCRGEVLLEGKRSPSAHLRTSSTPPTSLSLGRALRARAQRKRGRYRTARHARPDKRPRSLNGCSSVVVWGVGRVGVCGSLGATSFQLGWGGVERPARESMLVVVQCREGRTDPVPSCCSACGAAGEQARGRRRRQANVLISRARRGGRSERIRCCAFCSRQPSFGDWRCRWRVQHGLNIRRGASPVASREHAVARSGLRSLVVTPTASH